MSNYQERVAAANDVQELLDDPEFYGLPTFQQWLKLREDWERQYNPLAQVDSGSRQLDKHVQRHIYEIEGYRCKTLEEVERVAKEQGIPHLEYRPTVIPTGAGKCDILVKFVSSNEFNSRKEW